MVALYSVGARVRGNVAHVCDNLIQCYYLLEVALLLSRGVLSNVTVHVRGNITHIWGASI